jgi:hypothetical protein
MDRTLGKTLRAGPLLASPKRMLRMAQGNLLSDHSYGTRIGSSQRMVATNPAVWRFAAGDCSRRMANTFCRSRIGGNDLRIIEPIQAPNAGAHPK